MNFQLGKIFFFFLFFTCSMFFLASSSAFLSLMSFELCQVLICSLRRCSFFISFFNSDSYFSFWFKFVAVWIWMRETINSCYFIFEQKNRNLIFFVGFFFRWHQNCWIFVTFCQTSSNVSTPSLTFLRVLSISPCSLRLSAIYTINKCIVIWIYFFYLFLYENNSNINSKKKTKL